MTAPGVGAPEAGVVLVGASPKARLVLDFLASEGRAGEVTGLVDRDPARAGELFCGKPILGDLEGVLRGRDGSRYAFCPCLSERYFEDRARIEHALVSGGHVLASVFSRAAAVSSSARVAPGSIVFPGARVNAGARVGSCVTIYTAALVEHDCVIEGNVDISPRAVLAGGATVRSRSFIGVNATILPHISVGAGAIVGAGAVVVHDVADGCTVAGNPARVIRAAGA